MTTMHESDVRDDPYAGWHACPRCGGQATTVRGKECPCRHHVLIEYTWHDVGTDKRVCWATVSCRRRREVFPLEMDGRRALCPLCLRAERAEGKPVPSASDYKGILSKGRTEIDAA